MTTSRNELLTVTLQDNPQLNVALSAPQQVAVSLTAVPMTGTRNYNNLTNKPRINGIELQGDQNAVDLNLVSENTETGWINNQNYVPKRGEICLYSDLGRIKIGDGTVTIIDLPFIGANDNDALMTVIMRHSTNSTIHVTQQDRARWNAKLNYALIGEQLILTRE